MAIEVFSESAMRTIRRVVRQLVSREFDLSRPSRTTLPHLAGFVAKVDTTITARSGTTPGQGTAFIQSIDSVMADAVGTAATLQTIAVYSVETSPVASGSYINVTQDQMSGKYWLTSGVMNVTGQTLVIAKCDTGQSLLPGVTTAKTFSVYTWNGTTLTDSTTNIGVADPLNQNCILEGEYATCTDTGGGNYIPVGSQGLFRMAEADANIATTSSGTAQFFVNNAVSTIDVTVWNNYKGYNRRINAGYNDRCFIWYDSSQSKWVVIPPPLALLASGVLGGALNPASSTPDITTFAVRDWGEPFGRTETAPTFGLGMTNRYAHAGPSAQDVLMYRRVDASVGNWEPIDVEKQQIPMVRDLRLHTNNYVQSDLLDTGYSEAVSIVANWTDEILTEAC